MRRGGDGDHFIGLRGVAGGDRLLGQQGDDGSGQQAGAIKREVEDFIIYIFHNIQMISVIIIKLNLLRLQLFFIGEVQFRSSPSFD